LVDKQPDPNAYYYVLIVEGADRIGLYFPHKVASERVAMRVLVWAQRVSPARVLARRWFSLDPPEKDLQVTGSGTGPVFWRVGRVRGPEVKTQGGSYTLTLPAAPGLTFEIAESSKVVLKMYYNQGKWEEVPLGR
jgi:hypothetical protein